MLDKEQLSYHPPFILSNGHLQTIFPSLFRKLDYSFYRRERIYTPDDDFLDLDWSTQDNNRLAIVSHGLEGSSYRSYVVGMVRALNNNGWDALAWNYRSCSGETNRQLRFYHNGATEDLELVIGHALQTKRYKRISLVGFSMGGNLTLVYLGERSEKVNPLITSAVDFSVPCDLKSSAAELARPVNRIFMKRFLRMLEKKVVAKKKLFPEQIDDKDYHLIKDFEGFDDRYTAPIHGFKNAEDYWERCSSRSFITSVKIPTLLVNAANDPFLAAGCYPVEEAEANKYITLEIPQSGGHVGFELFDGDGQSWSEKRAIWYLIEN